MAFARAEYESKSPWSQQGTNISFARRFSGLGPFVAIGKPGEALAHEGGAARLYVADEDWKQVVEFLVHRASAVVLQPEPTEGTLWETMLAAGALNHGRILFIVPNPHLRPLGFPHVKQMIAHHFRLSLPSQEEWPKPHARKKDLVDLLQGVLGVKFRGPELSIHDAVYFNRHGRSAAVSLARNAETALAGFVESVRRASEGVTTEAT